MKPKQRARAVKCLKYYGDIFGITTVTEMDKRIRKVNARAKAMEKEKNDEDKRSEKEALRILRKVKKEADRDHVPRH